MNAAPPVAGSSFRTHIAAEISGTAIPTAPYMQRNMPTTLSSRDTSTAATTVSANDVALMHKRTTNDAIVCGLIVFDKLYHWIFNYADASIIEY